MRARQQFGRLVKAAMEKKGLSQNRLGGIVSEFEGGRVFDSSAIRTIIQGTRRPDKDLVDRLVRALAPYLDEGEAYWAAGFWPPGLTIDGYRKVLADASTDQDTDGRVRGSIRPCAAHLQLLRPDRATSRISLPTAPAGVAAGVAA